MEPHRKPRSADRIPCDFCNEEVAVLYCRADSAKLCLFCDFHVHSANDLSRKHLRSQICDNCGSEPVTVRCSTDNLVLCTDCDWDAHGNCSVSASHDRNAVEGFTGCPSAMDLAATFGFNVEDEKSLLQVPFTPLQDVNANMFENWCSLDSVLSSVDHHHSMMNLQDLMVVPCNNGPAAVYPKVSLASEIAASDAAVQKRQSQSCCGKQRQLLYKQLVEMVKRDLSKGDGGTVEDLGPGTPGRSAKQGSFEGGDEGMEANHHQLLQEQTTPYTSLLISAVCGDFNGNEGVVEEDGLWDSNTRSRQCCQIWDFHSGRSRNHEVPSQLDIGYSTADAGFLMENYSDLIESTSMEATKVLEDIYRINCSTLHEDIKSPNNKSNNPALSQRPTSSESNNLTTPRASSGLTLANPKASTNTKDVHLMEQAHQTGGETARVTTKPNIELLAQNRGNAMLRYKEKKKTRRYDKHIRYESRKARADTRKRVKGRFVKASEAPDIETSR